MKKPRSSTILATTFGWDLNEVKEYQYKSTRTKQPIYSIGQQYFAVSQNKPTDDVGGEWKKYSDQFFAERYNTVIWVCEETKEENLTVSG